MEASLLLNYRQKAAINRFLINGILSQINIPHSNIYLTTVWMFINFAAKTSVGIGYH